MAFAYVDHSILLHRLQVAVGIGRTALDWIRSFLSGRTRQVVYVCQQSVILVVLFGVPHGSVLGLLLYVLDTAPLFHVTAQHQVDSHRYADDLQLYLCVPSSEASVATNLSMRVWSTSMPG